jgi:hypothetical protein
MQLLRRGVVGGRLSRLTRGSPSSIPWIDRLRGRTRRRTASTNDRDAHDRDQGENEHGQHDQ